MKLIQGSSTLSFLVLITLLGCNEKADHKPEATNELPSDSLVYDTSPRWMKTSHNIIFYTYRHDPDGAELYSISPDGTNLTRLTDTYHNEWWSDISPDDKLIYISSDFGKSERFGGSEIFSLNEAGDFTRITFDSDTSSFNIHPRVSPDGNNLLYCSNCLGEEVNSEVILIQADGKNPINLTDHPSQDKYGSWSPDGKKVLFESNRTGNFELYVLDLDTKKLTRLTNNEYDDKQGDWSVNNEIVFISDRDGDFELFTMNADGSDQQQITFNQDRDVLPSWSPDGSRIAFSSYRFGEKDKGDIFVIDPDGKNEFRVTKN